MLHDSELRVGATTATRTKAARNISHQDVKCSITVHGLGRQPTDRNQRLLRVKGHNSMTVRGRRPRPQPLLWPDYQNACKVTMFSTLYLELPHESYNVPAMLYIVIIQNI